MSSADTAINNWIGIIILSAVAYTMTPTVVEYLTNLSALATNPFGALFSTVLVLLIYIGLFMQVKKMVGVSK